MARGRPPKKPVFSCRLTNGETLVGDYVSSTNSIFKVLIDELEFNIPENSCLWWAVGKKSYSIIKEEQHKLMKAEAQAYIEQLLASRKVKESSAPILPPSEQPRPPVGTPDQDLVIDENDEQLPVGDRVRATQERVRTEQASFRAIAEHQQRLTRVSTVVIQPAASIPLFPPEAPIRMAPVRRLKEQGEELDVP